MDLNRIKQLARVARGFPDYLKKPITLEKAIDDIKTRMGNREQNFLTLARRLIYENQPSPYRKLLIWAGCDYKDLKDSVRTKGIEKTLEALRDEGVYITLEEFKSKIPIARRGITFETSPVNFDNPFLMGKSIPVSTSGSRSKRTRVPYDWDFIAEESANELVLYEIHELSQAPLALWYPSLPSIAGIHNLLMNIKFHKPPDKWFAHLDNKIVRHPLEYRLAVNCLLGICRLFGLSVPNPEFTDLDSAIKVARWMAATKKRKGICVVRTYASSAIRVVQAAIDNNLDISGNVIFTGGEPLTERRLRFIESAGVRAFARYVATETGLIGASCADRNYPDDMHIYLDRLAIIQKHRRTYAGDGGVDGFLLTTLLASTGKVLLNTDIGDFGKLLNKPCNCLFGGLGMNVHISEVGSYDKLTGEGMTLLSSDLNDILGELVGKAGGSPDDYQFWETQDSRGFGKLLIAINPELKKLNEKDLIETILERLLKKNLGSKMIAKLWKQAETIEVIRTYPKPTEGFKMLPIMKIPRDGIF